MKTKKRRYTNDRPTKYTPSERFFRKVQKTDTCWNWTGSLAKGYGQFWLLGKKISPHKFSYLTFVGPIAEGLFVCHRCDNPQCVRPDHLFLGTGKENSQDMVAKGRGMRGRRIRHLSHQSKLAIFQLVSVGIGKQAVADQFGISIKTVRRYAATEVIEGESSDG